MNPPNDPPEVNVNGQTSTIERPQTSAAIAGKIHYTYKNIYDPEAYRSFLLEFLMDHEIFP